MRTTRFSLNALSMALFMASSLPALAQMQVAQYNPTNPASPTGFTTGHELNRTIGCPGQGILGTPCPEPVATRPAAPAKAAPAAQPAAQPAAAPVEDRWLRSYLYVPTGVRETSGLMVERSVPREVVAGQPFDYMLKVTNLTPATLTDVAVQDVCGDNFKLIDSKPAATKLDAGTLVWNLGEMQPKEVRQILVRGAYPAGAAARNCVSASYDMAACQDLKVVEPKLALAVSAPAEILRCEPIPVRYTVSNPGTGAATDASLTQNAPQGMTAKDGTLVGVTSLGDLAAGASRTLETVFTAAKPGVYEFAPVAGAKPELKAEASAKTRVTEPALKVEKTLPGTLILGRELTYDITVSNTGDAKASSLVLEEALPRGAKFVSASDGGRAEAGRVVWNLSDLAPGASRTVRVTMNTESIGDLEVTTRAKAYCAADADASAKANVIGVPAVLLELIDVNDPVVIGNEEIFTITVTNQGTATDINVRIVASLENSMEFVAAQGATAPVATGQRIEFAPLPRLEPGAKATWTVRAKGVSPADHRFTVVMTSDLRQRPVMATEATTVYK